jgi:hypothetical protein
MFCAAGGSFEGLHGLQAALGLTHAGDHLDASASHFRKVLRLYVDMCQPFFCVLSAQTEGTFFDDLSI